jgi:hypothetical protein
VLRAPHTEIQNRDVMLCTTYENGRVGRCTAIHEQKQCDARGHICPIACGRCKPCPGHPRYSSSDTELRAAMVDRDRRFACAPSGFLCSSANSSSSRDRRAAAKRLREPLDTEVVVSVLLQYFRTAINIDVLSRWKQCEGVELLVNVDSREAADLRWLNTTADHVTFSHNIHELRAYTRLAAMAAAPVLFFAQDDAPPPAGCEYLQHMSAMLSASPTLGAIGWRNHYLSPRGYSNERRVSTMRLWPNPGDPAHASLAANESDPTNASLLSSTSLAPGLSSFYATYTALLDIGPLLVRAEAFRAVGGFPQDFSERGMPASGLDVELCRRLWRAGWTVAYYGASQNLCFECLPTARPSHALGSAGIRARTDASLASERVIEHRKRAFATGIDQWPRIEARLAQLNAPLAEAAPRSSSSWSRAGSGAGSGAESGEKLSASAHAGACCDVLSRPSRILPYANRASASASPSP